MSRTFILISPEAEKLGAKHLPIFFRHPVPLIPFKILVWHHLIHFIKGGVMTKFNFHHEYVSNDHC